jgi:hypothetical protein
MSTFRESYDLVIKVQGHPPNTMTDANGKLLYSQNVTPTSWFFVGQPGLVLDSMISRLRDNVTVYGERLLEAKAILTTLDKQTGEIACTPVFHWHAGEDLPERDKQKGRKPESASCNGAP